MLVVRTLPTASVALFTCTVGALAEDNFDWSRPYVGAAVGLGGSGAVLEAPGQPDVELDDGSAQFSIYVGKSLWTFGESDIGAWAIGVEGSATWLRGRDRKAAAGLAGDVSLEANWIADASLQIGYQFTETRFFATAGAALSDIDVEGAGRKGDSVSAGLKLGLGAEYAFSQNWVGRLDASVTGFGEKDARFGADKRDLGVGVSALRVGLSRRF
ncbi:MAG: porin family protein [Rhodobacteraceae bacterium]|nr:porin family protein [Paracoccaceae bacterium]